MNLGIILQSERGDSPPTWLPSQLQLSWPVLTFARGEVAAPSDSLTLVGPMRGCWRSASRLKLSRIGLESFALGSGSTTSLKRLPRMAARVLAIPEGAGCAYPSMS